MYLKYKMYKYIFFFFFFFYSLLNTPNPQPLTPNYLYAEELRDPFVSLGDRMELAKKPAQDDLSLPYPIVLKGTMRSKNNFLAIVNDDIIKQGSMWQDFYVAQIQKDKIILEWRGKKFEIALAQESK